MLGVCPSSRCWGIGSPVHRLSLKCWEYVPVQGVRGLVALFTGSLSNVGSTSQFKVLGVGSPVHRLSLKCWEYVPVQGVGGLVALFTGSLSNVGSMSQFKVLGDW